MRFEQSVRVLTWTGKLLLGISEDSAGMVYNHETQSVTQLLPGHEGSARNGAIDPLGTYIATTGCDGTLHIYKISDEEEVNLISKVTISKKTNPDS